jgi:hypothetical protein
MRPRAFPKDSDQDAFSLDAAQLGDFCLPN